MSHHLSDSGGEGLAYRCWRSDGAETGKQRRGEGEANPLGHFTSVDGEPPKCQIVIRKLFSFHSAADISPSGGDGGTRVCWGVVWEGGKGTFGISWAGPGLGESN